MNKFSTIIDFLKFLKHRKKFWLIPVVLVVFVIGLLITFAQGSIVAPLIYPLF